MIVNTGDDERIRGLHVSPDVDTVLYHLAGATDWDRGWGLDGETFVANDRYAELVSRAGMQDVDMQEWFGLGDRDLATHLIRTRMLDAGYPLSAVTAALADRWQPGVTLLPMSDQRVETHVVVSDPETDRQRAIHFQEWWVRYRAQVETHSFAFVGAEAATAGPGVTEAIEEADAVLLAPSNPVVSIGSILAMVAGTTCPLTTPRNSRTS